MVHATSLGSSAVRVAAPPRIRVVEARAASIDAAFLNELRRGPLQATVHSVFERVVNLQDQRGTMFTLGCRGLDNAPNTAIVRLPGFGDCALAQGDAVQGDEGGIRLSPTLSISLAQASTWECALPRYPAQTSRLRTNLRWLQGQLERLGAAGGMLAPPRGGSAFETAVAGLLAEHSQQLQLALTRGDEASARRHACSLLGLGPGLTPSGDDFLVGLFAVLNIAGSPCHGWLGGGAEVMAGAARSTHAISLAALTQAVRGRVRESIAALIGQLMHGSPGHLAPALRRVLAIGSTSGTDIVAGIRCGLELNISQEGRHPCQSRW